MRVLAVDNDELVLTAMKIALEEIEAAPITVSQFEACPGPEEFFNALNTQIYDVAFIDLDMGKGIAVQFKKRWC